MKGCVLGADVGGSHMTTHCLCIFLAVLLYLYVPLTFGVVIVEWQERLAIFYNPRIVFFFLLHKRYFYACISIRKM